MAVPGTVPIRYRVFLFLGTDEVFPEVFQDVLCILFKPFHVVSVDFIDHLLTGMDHELDKLQRVDSDGQAPGDVTPLTEPVLA